MRLQIFLKKKTECKNITELNFRMFSRYKKIKEDSRFSAAKIEDITLTLMIQQ